MTSLPPSKRSRLASNSQSLVSEVTAFAQQSVTLGEDIVISSKTAKKIVEKAQGLPDWQPHLMDHVIDSLQGIDNVEITDKALKVFNAPTDDSRVTSLKPLIPAGLLQSEIPLTPKVQSLVLRTRNEVGQITNSPGLNRLLVVCGPCSIHNVDLALTYAKSLREIVTSNPVIENNLLVVMRVYFEKPRTTVGWKGLINDPNLNGTFEINKGLRQARQLLFDINNLGMPVGCEFLDTISPQYTADLVSWGAIGARTTECQLHRELASGLSCPIGFKNGTSGSVQIAVDACTSASNPHRFLGINKNGLAAIVGTSGNKHAHVILRGGHSGTNYDSASIKAAAEKLDGKSFSNVNIVVDCSHGNSHKDHRNQPKVLKSVADQVRAGEKRIAGVMMESNINEGKQTLKPGVTDVSSLKYGVSVTDACMSIGTTKDVLLELATAVAEARAS